jgi:hypothetical protein
MKSSSKRSRILIRKEIKKEKEIKRSNKNLFKNRYYNKMTLSKSHKETYEASSAK